MHLLFPAPVPSSLGWKKGALEGRVKEELRVLQLRASCLKPVVIRRSPFLMARIEFIRPKILPGKISISFQRKTLKLTVN